jgi:hypothetical protein
MTDDAIARMDDTREQEREHWYKDHGFSFTFLTAAPGMVWEARRIHMEWHKQRKEGHLHLSHGVTDGR